MGSFGRITKRSDLPSDAELLRLIKEAIRLNDEGVKRVTKPRPKGNRELVVPDCLTAALKKNKQAHATFGSFSYSHKKEYVEWLTEGNASRRATVALPRRSNGLPKARRAIGNTRIANGCFLNFVSPPMKYRRFGRNEVCRCPSFPAAGCATSSSGRTWRRRKSRRDNQENLEGVHPSRARTGHQPHRNRARLRHVGNAARPRSCRRCRATK